MSSDPLATSKQDPDDTWVIKDRLAAAGFAETLARHLQSVSDEHALPDP